MASVYKEIELHSPADQVWNAIRDIGAIHTGFARGFVTNTVLDGDSRVVTFANGAVVRERIVTVDDERRRLAYSVVEWRASHHNASFEVRPIDAHRCQLVWIADLLPDELAPQVDGMMQQGCAAIKRTLEHEVLMG
jgi:Polyketide cyclase / dehydrase and lipid transport